MNFAKFFTAVLLLLSAPLSAKAASLCQSNEIVIFNCHAQDKLYQICAARAESGLPMYMQLRVASKNKLEFNFPTPAALPKDYFKFTLLSRSAALSLRTQEGVYEFVEPLLGLPTVAYQEHKTQSVTAFECQSRSETLTLNSIQSQLRKMGVAD